METYDVSVDTFASELINYEKSDPLTVKLIEQYYTHLYQNVTPINLIEGKTLQFGNRHLSSLF